MESTTAPLARTAPTHGLAELFERPGPFVTVVVETDAAIPNASQRTMQRWTSQRDEALRSGVPEAAIDRIDELLPDAHLEGPAVYVVADGESGEPLLVEHLAAVPDGGGFVRWGAVPSVVPLLADRQARLPHVVVRCDIEGADVLAVDADGRAEDETVKSATKPSDLGRDNVGWRQRASWNRARRHLNKTADEIAAAAAEAAAPIGAQLVLVTGTERVADEVVDRLLHRGLDARPVAGGRGGDSSDEHVDEGVQVAVRTVAAEHTVAALRRFREQQAHGLAVDGFHDVRAALAEGRVDALLVHDEGRDDRPVDETIRLALGTSAGVLVLPTHAGPAEGVGALLRWR